MASNDYFLRQIEGMTDLLSTMLFGRTADDKSEIEYDTRLSAADHELLIDLRLLVNHLQLNEAENLLFEQMEQNPGSHYHDIADQFYAWLDDLSDEELTRANFPRPEIAEGHAAVVAFYNR